MGIFFVILFFIFKDSNSPTSFSIKYDSESTWIISLLTSDKVGSPILITMLLSFLPEMKATIRIKSLKASLAFEMAISKS